MPNRSNSTVATEISISSETTVARLFSMRTLRSAGLFFITALVLFIASSESQAQSIQYTQNKPDQALRSAMRVDPSTLGLSIDVPIGSYQGRGGTSLPVNLSYSSKQWRIAYEESWLSNGGLLRTESIPMFSEWAKAGWTAVDFDESKPFSAVAGYSFDQLAHEYDFDLVQLNPNGTVQSQFVSVDLTDVALEVLSGTLFGKSWLSGKMSVQTTIADWTGQLKDIPMAMSIFPPKPPTPGGMTTNKFGTDVMKWGSRDGAARERMATLTRKELEEGGVTRAMAEQWRDFYREVARVTPQNGSAAGRADLMQRAVELLSGPK